MAIWYSPKSDSKKDLKEWEDCFMMLNEVYEQYDRARERCPHPDNSRIFNNIPEQDGGWYMIELCGACGKVFKKSEKDELLPGITSVSD